MPVFPLQEILNIYSLLLSGQLLTARTSVHNAYKSVVKEEGETRLLSNLNLELVLCSMKEATRILVYEITALLGIIPFIIFRTRRAPILGLTKRDELVVALLLWGDMMLLPWALQTGWIIGWILSIIMLVVSGILWSEVKKTKMKDKVLATKITVQTENHSTAEITSKIQVNTIQAVKVVEVTDVQTFANAEEITISVLIDLGFQEKSSENFEQAVFHFLWALSLDPMPDLAFYLIIDCYWLWNNLGMRDYALTQLQVYVQKYFPQFNTQFRYQFETWMTKEDLHKIFE